MNTLFHVFHYRNINLPSSYQVDNILLIEHVTEYENEKFQNSTSSRQGEKVFLKNHRADLIDKKLYFRSALFVT